MVELVFRRAKIDSQLQLGNDASEYYPQDKVRSASLQSVFDLHHFKVFVLIFFQCL